MKHSEPLILNKEEFFEGFDNPSLQEKVVGVKIALLQNVSPSRQNRQEKG